MTAQRLHLVKKVYERVKLIGQTALIRVTLAAGSVKYPRRLWFLLGVLRRSQSRWDV